MTRPAESSFDRLRPRAPISAAEPTWVGSTPSDGQGRRALFSVHEPGVPAFGSVSIECSGCRETSVLALRQALRLAVPSLYLPIIRRHYPAWLHCPACGAWTWTKVRMRI